MARKTRKAASTAQTASFDSEDVKEARKALLRAVEEPPTHKNDRNDDDNPTTWTLQDFALVTLFTEERCGTATNPTEQKNLLCQVVREFTTADMRRFCNAVAPQVHTLVESQAYLPSETDSPSPNDPDDEASLASETTVTKLNSPFLRVLHFFRYTSLLLNAFLEGRQKPNHTLSILPEFWQVLVPLHDIMLNLDDCGPAGRLLQSSLLQLCESLWHAKVNDRTHVVAQTFSLLVNQALEQGSTARRWNRLFEMREALDVVDWDDASSRWLRSRLLALASSPHCLQQTAGKRFLANILQLEPDVDYDVAPNTKNSEEEDNGDDDDDDDKDQPLSLHALAADLHQAIRVQVPSAKTSMLEAYGEIYWRAWKDTQDENVRARLEATVWQDWIYAILHVQQPATYKAVRSLLQPLHQQAKSVQGGPELLHRLYGPILWRSLRATHPVVRLHAAHCLGAVFPLTTPTRVLPATTQACEALHELLQDSDDRVRVAGVQVVGEVVGVYWDALPVSALRTLLNTMVTQLASDAPSSNVRASVLTAVTKLLEQSNTHAVLRPLLPALGNLLHDRVENVRVAAVRLLLQIKATPGFKYYHVVPVHHLLARLATETKSTGPVAQALTALMLNSYVPSDNRQAITRTVRFLQENPTSAQVFYANVAAHMPVTQVVKLTLLLWKALMTAIHGSEAEQMGELKGNNKRLRTKGRQSKSTADSENDVASPGDFTGLVSRTDITLWSRLAETISVLWGSVENEIDQSDYNECHLALMDGFAGEILMKTLKLLEQGPDETQDDRYRTAAAILRCCGRLPSDAVHDLVQYIGKVLDNPTVNSSAHVALLCLWGKTEQVAPILAYSLSNTNRGLFRLSNSPLNDSDISPIDSTIALGIVTDLLRGSDPSSVAARESILQSPTARSSLATALEKGLHRVQVLLKDGNVLADMPKSEVEHVLKLCELYGRFCLHMQSDPSETGLNDYAGTLLHWTTHNVLPVLSSSPETGFEDVNISRISMDQSFRTPLSPLASPAPRRRSNRNKTPTRLDGGLESSSQQPVAPANPVATNRLQKDLAVSLLRMTSLLFCEWMAVGRPGVVMVAQAAKEWTQALDTEQSKLLPSLARLAMQLIRAGHDSSVLQTMLVRCSESKDTKSLYDNLITLLSVRGHATKDIREAISVAVANALSELVDSSDVNLSDKLSVSLEEAWPYSSGAIITAVRALTSNPKGTSALARALLDNFEDRSEKFRLVTLHILFVLLSEEVSDELPTIVRGLEQVSLDPETRASSLVQELVEVASA